MILEIIQKHVKLQRVNATGTEYCGPCPWCAGVDRFLVWPGEAGGKGNFLCRQCGRKGDGIQFLREKENLTYAEACSKLNITQQWNRRLSPVDTSWKQQTPTQRVVAAETKEIETNAPGEVIATVDDIQEDASAEVPTIVDTVQETPFATSAAITDPGIVDDNPEQICTKIVSSESDMEVITTLPEPILVETLARQWRDMDLIDLLPAGRRAEAGAILEADPNKRQILALCKVGVYDCFTAMAKLGLPDPHLGDLSIRPGPLSEDHIEPTAWTGELPLPCLDCNHHFNGWCRRIVGPTVFNIKFIHQCNGVIPEPVAFLSVAPVGEETNFF